MRKTIAPLAFLAMGATLMTLHGQGNGKSLRANLTTYQEVPAVATTATGNFTAKINDAGTAVDFELTYEGVQGGNATMAHIHLGARRTNGGVVAFLCGGGGKAACPAAAGTVKGTITGADIQALAAQGVAAGDIAKVIRAMQAGATYVNVHSTAFAGGELRGQINDPERGNGNGNSGGEGNGQTDDPSEGKGKGKGKNDN